MQRLKLPLKLLAVFLVALIAWSLRARAANLLPIDYDEDDYLRAGQEFAHLIRTEDWRGFLNTNYRPEHPPLAKFAYGLAILSQPEQPLIPDVSITANPASSLPVGLLHTGRTEAAIFGTLTAFLLALVNPLGGLILAVHSMTIKYTSEVMLDGLSALLSLSTVLAYVRFKKSRRIGWLIGSAVLLGLAADSKFLHGTIGFVILLDWVWTDWSRLAQRGQRGRALRAILGWGLLALAVFFILDPYLWPDPIGRLGETFAAVQATTTNSNVASANLPFWQPITWLFFSVKAWHPGVFQIVLDPLISILALVGIVRLWKRERVYALWLIVALCILLVWRTKWPQYMLILTAPLSLAAAEGVATIFSSIRASISALKNAPEEKVSRVTEKTETHRALPWLVPGLIGLAALTVIPILFQFAMAFTDFSGSSIRDGLTGGVWRALWLGLTGQVKPVQFNPFSPGGYFSKEVHFAGPALLWNLIGGGSNILIFDVVWTVLAVASQAILGIGAALLLERRGTRAVNLWRTVFILPWAIPEFVGALIWLRSFEPQIGWATMILPAGARAAYPNALGTGGFALTVLLVAAAWSGFPFIMLAATASLKLVPREVYDAAAMDGASGWSLFREVTWPLLLPLVAPALILRAIYSFNQFYLFYVMRTDFPMTTLSNISYYYMTYANQYAVSAGINVISILALVIFLLWFNRWSKASAGVTYA